MPPHQIKTPDHGINARAPRDADAMHDLLAKAVPDPTAAEVSLALALLNDGSTPDAIVAEVREARGDAWAV